MFNSPFGPEDNKKKHVEIPASCDIVFVADMFAKDYIGGAELTTQALIDSVPDDLNVFTVRSGEISMETLESGYNKFWIFTNFSAMDYQLIPSIVANLKYSVVEYDYKFCKYRSVEKHKFNEQEECDCHEDVIGKLVSAFFHGAKTVFYMSEAQKNRYTERFPFLDDPNEGSNQTVLSSCFDDGFFAAIKTLREKQAGVERKGWIVLDSNSWIKGTQAATNWCEENNLDYELVGGVSYDEMLAKLAAAEGFVYLPEGGDTCPRMVLEAQLLGCKLHTNDNVQHQSEFPFTGGSLEDIEIYLYSRREVFWQQTMSDMVWKPKISGYTTTYNCISQDYPFTATISSMLNFCTEVVVLDGGSTDGTWEKLEELAALQEDGRLKVHKNVVDWKAPRHAVEDGLQKARARDLCTGDFCWQMDCDEVVHENDCQKIVKLCRQFPKFVDIVSLPVVEFWGSVKKIRMDINPWKWRLSRNVPNITHGIPSQLRLQDENGELYASGGTDGCDYIHKETHELIPHASFYTQEIHEIRMKGLSGSQKDYEAYAHWFVRVMDLMPSVYHYSWFDIERKIKTYKNYWQTHWESLYNVKQEDTVDNNMFFNKPWKQVSEEEIEELAGLLSDKMGGWIFHRKIDFSQPTPWIQIEDITHPKAWTDLNE